MDDWHGQYKAIGVPSAVTAENIC